jgi:SAM-dependent methyltransferase
MTNLNPIAQSSFANSTAYNTHRPSYPAYSIQHLLEQCRVAGKKGARVVDLGAGTGIFTEALAAREEGFEIVAVEPHADMRAVLEKRNLPGVKVVDGTAEDVPVENGWADAVFVAQVGGWILLPGFLMLLGAFSVKASMRGMPDLWRLGSMFARSGASPVHPCGIRAAAVQPGLSIGSCFH